MRAAAAVRTVDGMAAAVSEVVLMDPWGSIEQRRIGMVRTPRCLVSCRWDDIAQGT